MKKRTMGILAGTLCLAMCASPMICLAEEAAEETTVEAAVEEETAEEEVAEEETAEEEVAEEPVVEEVTIGAYPQTTMSDFVTLGDYKGLSISVPESVIMDEDVEQAFENVIQNYIISQNKYEYVTEGTLQEGDTANIDYVGKKDGEAFEGGTAQGYDLTLGSGTFIPGFEEGLIGVEVGSTVEIPLTFPEEYHSEELAGQDVVFEVTVNSIRTTPEPTDEMAAEITDHQYETLDALKGAIRDLLQQQSDANQDSQIFSSLLDQIHANTEIGEIPQELVDYWFNINKFYMQEEAKSYGMTLEQMLSAYGMTMEQYDEQMKASLQDSIWMNVLPLAIAETEGIAVTDEDYQTRMGELAEQRGEELESVISSMEERYTKDYLQLTFLIEKVQNFLKENADITYTANEAEEVLEEAEEAVEEAEEAVEEAEEALEEVEEVVGEEETGDIG